MKKNLIVTLALGLFFVSCQNSGSQPDASSGTSVKKPSQPDAMSGKSGTKPTAQVSKPDMDCIAYSIFNPHAPTGPNADYSYLDCSGRMQGGSVNPQETVNVLALPGSVKCPGGVVTEDGKSTKTDPAQAKP